MVLHVLHKEAQQQLIPGFRQEVHGWTEWSLQKSREVNTNQNTSLVRVIYIITMLEFRCSKSCVRWNLTNALETQSPSSMAHDFLVHLSTSKLHMPMRCYWNIARGNAEKVHFKISQSFIFRRLPEATGWELLFTHHPSPPLKLCIAIKWFS